MQHRAVSEIFLEAIPNTLRLTVSVFIIQLIVGILLGVITALKKNGKLDVLINSILLFLYSMPGFWVALIAIMIFSLKLGWLPSSQMSSMHSIEGFWPVIWDKIRHLILPAAVLSIPFVTYTARFVRGSLIEVLRQPYMQTARAFGLKRSEIVFKYALKNTLLPVVTLIGLYIPFLLGGAVITEYIFGWPGMGRITVDAIFSYDYPVILASNFIAAFAVIIGNLISDLMYVIVDPRIQMKQI
jgi:peptide/nickel transport system permease protein